RKHRFARCRTMHPESAAGAGNCSDHLRALNLRHANGTLATEHVEIYRLARLLHQSPHVRFGERNYVGGLRKCAADGECLHTDTPRHRGGIESDETLTLKCGEEPVRRGRW